MIITTFALLSYLHGQLLYIQPTSATFALSGRRQMHLKCLGRGQPVPAGQAPAMQGRFWLSHARASSQYIRDGRDVMNEYRAFAMHAYDIL